MFVSVCHTEVCTGSTGHRTNHFRASLQYLQANSKLKLITASEAGHKGQLTRLSRGVGEKWSVAM